MPFTVTMPKLSPTMEEGTIVKWHAKEGDHLEADAVLIEVATDKATVEYNVLDEGYLRKVLIPENGAAVVNQPIAIFTATADESLDGYEPEGIAEEAPPESSDETVVAAAPKAAVATGSMNQPAFAPPPPLENHEFEWPTEPPSQRTLASPLAKKIASDRGIDLTTVKGSGPGGRIVKDDLEMAQSGSLVNFGSRQMPTEQAGSYESLQLTPMRKAIGERLQQSKTFIPHFYVSQEINATPMFDLRNQLKEGGVKLTFNDFVVRACALALKEFPHVNSGFNTTDNTVTLYKTVDIAIAVTIDGGLITPIVRWADYKSIGELSKEVRHLAAQAKEGKLQPEQYTGGSFTISNLGMYGVTDFQAVINPPQSAILAISGINERPVVSSGQVVPGRVMNVTLSADHRVVDGALAAQFICEVQRLLENPALFLL